ncbi:hypothetical protein F4779DRAFT_625115 [Xylariaceae sp. FL0662B]|nr:hypothetical protein F4779DRAFT_625115 [Xylariaceae sp. FL0662B]
MHLDLPSEALRLLLLLPLLLLTLSPTPTQARQPPPRPTDAILLSQVQSLTLRGGGAQTTHRRVTAIPQLRCVSSPGICRLHAVDVMRCANQGSGYDAQDVQWSCSTPLPPELRLGSTDVVCEGYAGPDDPYVLRGSCGVEYRLVLTEEGERWFPELARGGGSSWWGGGAGTGDGDGSKWDVGSVLFGIVFFLVCVWIIYSAFFAANENPRRPAQQRRPRNYWGWGGGGGGGGGGFDPGFGPGGGGNDPPPPYSKYPSTQNRQDWRPGFWSGLLGGAAAGYAAGNRGGRGNNRQEPRNYGSSWGAAGPSRPSPSGSPSSGSTSSARYESTGFGSTSRR